MAYDARAAANFFLELARKDGVAVSPMKLQKLLYFAHGWYLAVTDKPLLEERIEAWNYGPVIPDIYLEFKRFGNDPITALAMKPVKSRSEVPEPFELPEEDHTIRMVLSKVWEAYKGFSAIALSNMTHEKGTPWSKTVEPYLLKGKVPRDLIIADDLIRDFFSKDGQFGA